MTRCPVCQARFRTQASAKGDDILFREATTLQDADNAESNQCARCGSDFSALSAIDKKAQVLLQLGLQQALHGNYKLGLYYCHESLSSRHSDVVSMVMRFLSGRSTYPEEISEKT